MATFPTQAESQVKVAERKLVRLETLVELSEHSFKAFCDDISSILGVEIKCGQQQASPETVNSLQKRFTKPVAVISIKAEGSLNGTFQLVFEHKGLFALSAAMVANAQETIPENAGLGSPEKNENLPEPLNQACAAIVGSWDKILRQELDGHGSLVQAGIFIGNPWDKPEEKIGLAGNEESVFVPHEITIAPFPAFECGVIFPKALFSDESAPASEEAVSAEEGQQETVETATAPDEANPESSSPQTNGEKPEAQEPVDEKASIEEAKVVEAAAETTAVEEEASVAEQASPKAEEGGPEAAAEQEEKDNNANTGASDNVNEEKTATTEQTSDSGPISESIRQMTRSAAAPSDEPGTFAPQEKPVPDGVNEFLRMPAKDIMQKGVLWANPDDSIQQALAEMEQHNAGYMMIGNDGFTEGIVSKSDLKGAISPYLRPAFAKWRRPLDDATLQIKLKWVMTKPVHTISPETSLTAIMENMYSSGRRCLPVMDKENDVQGLVTVFDIFKALLKSEPNGSAENEPPQATDSA